MASLADRRSPNKSTPRYSKIGTYWPELLSLLVLLECVGVTLVARHFGTAGKIMWGIYYLIWLIPAAIVLLLTLAVWLWRLRRDGEIHPIQATLRKLRSVDRRDYIEIFVPALVMAPFMASFTSFKILLQNFSSLTYDPALARIDGTFGLQPWQISHAIIPNLGTVVLDRMYFAWLGISQLMLIAVLFVPQLRQQRGQVLLTFVISWILLGVFAAALLPSVGPCYYGNLYRPDVYAPLMQHLKAVDSAHHLTALSLQAGLWSDYKHQVVAIGAGVSAMPSMHVSVATITALFLRRINLAWLGAIWLVAIWIGSFHLGWHYLSDGLVSILATAAIWKSVSWLLTAAPSDQGQTISTRNC